MYEKKGNYYDGRKGIRYGSLWEIFANQAQGRRNNQEQCTLWSGLEDFIGQNLWGRNVNSLFKDDDKRTVPCAVQALDE